MKALVTGATGFIGGHLVEALIARRDEAFVLIRPGGRGRIALPRPLSSGAITAIRTPWPRPFPAWTWFFTPAA